MATELFSLVATLGLDTKSFTSGLSSAWDTISGFVKDVYGAGLEFDRAMGNIAGVRMLDPAGEEINDLRNYILDLAPASKFTAAEIANAALEMSKLGWTSDEIKGGLKSVIDLSAATGEDLARTAYIMSSGMAQFGVDASRASEYADVLAVVAANSGTDIRLLGESMKYAGPVAGALGYDFKDVAQSIGEMANQGTRGSMAGTSLRNVFVRLATNIGETQNKMGALSILTQQLGVDFYDSTGKARPWADVVADARENWRSFAADASPEVLEQLGSAFGVSISDINNTEEAVTEFKTAFTELQEAWNEAEGDSATRESMFLSYEGAFRDLGIETREANGEMRDMNSLIEEANTKFSGLSDEQKISYSHTIGSMRGMVGWLELMESSVEKSEQLETAIGGASGAVEKMAAYRLDNLGGDIDMLGSRVDTMYQAIYRNTQGDARSVVGELITSVDNITTAINTAGEGGGDALIAGIEQAGKEVDRLLTILTPIFEPIMVRLGGLLSTVLTTALNTLLTSDLVLDLVDLAAQLGEGITVGVLHALAQNADPATKKLFGFFGINLDDYIEFDASAISKSWNEGLASEKPNFDPIMADVKPTDPFADPTMVESWDTYMLQQKVEDTVEEGILTGGETAFNGMTVTAEDFANNTGRYFAGDVFVEAGDQAGLKFGNHVFNKIKLKTPEMQEEVATKIGNAGTSAGNDLVSGIQGILGAAMFGINIVASLFGNGQGYAKAMNPGYILNGATVFGFNRRGQPLIGGEAGQEAVIGTRALTTMITEAVAAGGAGTGDVNIVINQQPGESAESLADKVQRVLVRRERQRRAATA